MLQFLLDTYTRFFPPSLREKVRQTTIGKVIKTFAEKTVFERRLKKFAGKQPVDNSSFPFLLPAIQGSGNDYTFLEDKKNSFNKDDFSLPVSLIVPVYNRKEILAKTLAALVHQTYPNKLFEVIVTDDGSSDNVEEIVNEYNDKLTVKFITQEDIGYRLAAARNNGVEAASYENLIFLDCDMLPLPRFIEEYMVWFHCTSKAVLIGGRRFVNTDLIKASQIEQDISIVNGLKDIAPQNDVLNPKEQSTPMPDWRVEVFNSTGNLKNDPHPFWVACGGNVGMTKEAFHAVGGCDEDFQVWGSEDIELAFRLYQKGYYFIPVSGATGLHQEHEIPESMGKERKDAQANSHLLAAQKIPAPLYRPRSDNAPYEIPKVSIYIPAYNAGRYIKQAVDSVLMQTYEDYEVCICNDGSRDNTLEVLEKHYVDNPKVHWKTIENGGIGRASNEAVQMCKGLYVGQLDADDCLKPDALEIMVSCFDAVAPEVGCVYSTYEKIDENGRFLDIGYNWPVFSREKLLSNMIVHHFRMFRQRDWSRTEGFDEHIENAVDYDFYMKLSEVCDFFHVNKVLYQRRIHGYNTSIVKEQIQTQNTYSTVNKMLSKYNLDNEWQIIVDPENPRDVGFERITR